MKNKSLIILLTSLVIVFIGIYVSDQLGYWSTTSSALVKEGDDTTDYIISPEELRGSSSFDEIEASFAIPSDLLAKAYNFDTQEPGLLEVKFVSESFEYLGDEVEMGTGSVRMFIYIYNDLDMSSIEEIENLPSTAVEVLKEEGKWSDDVNALMSEYIVDIEVGAFSDDTLEVLMEDDHEEDDLAQISGELEINGKTTIQDIMDSGVSLEDIESILGLEVANVNLGFRDICEQNGLTFNIAKDEILSLSEDKE